MFAHNNLEENGGTLVIWEIYCAWRWRWASWWLLLSSVLLIFLVNFKCYKVDVMNNEAPLIRIVSHTNLCPLRKSIIIIGMFWILKCFLKPFFQFWVSFFNHSKFTGTCSVSVESCQDNGEKLFWRWVEGAMNEGEILIGIIFPSAKFYFRLYYRLWNDTEKHSERLSKNWNVNF